jgi:hypothetical protein
LRALRADDPRRSEEETIDDLTFVNPSVLILYASGTGGIGGM